MTRKTSYVVAGLFWLSLLGWIVLWLLLSNQIDELKAKMNFKAERDDQRFAELTARIDDLLPSHTDPTLGDGIGSRGSDGIGSRGSDGIGSRGSGGIGSRGSDGIGSRGSDP